MISRWCRAGSKPLNRAYSVSDRRIDLRLSSSFAASAGDTFKLIVVHGCDVLVPDHLLALVAPCVGPAVLEPEDHRRGVGRDVLAVGRVDWSGGVGRHENLDRVVCVA